MTTFEHWRASGQKVSCLVTLAVTVASLMALTSLTASVARGDRASLSEPTLTPELTFAGVALSADGGKSVLLKEGLIGRYEWWSEVLAAPKASETKEGYACLSVALVEPPRGNGGREGNEVEGCGLPSAGVPIVETFVGGLRGKRRTAMAVLVGGAASYGVLKFQVGPQVKVRMHRVSPGGQAAIGVGPLSYFTRGYAGQRSVKRFVAYGAAGEIVASTGP